MDLKKFGTLPNLYQDVAGVRVYVVPDEAIPDGGSVVVNGARLYIQSEAKLREREAYWRGRYEELHSARPIGLPPALWRWLCKLVRRI